MKKTILFFLLFSFIGSYAQDSSRAQINYFNTKVLRYLDRDKTLMPYYSISANGVKIYANANDKLKDSVEFHIQWSQLQNFRVCLKNGFGASYFKSTKYNKSILCVNTNDKKIIPDTLPGKRLKGLRIAIDPGHIAGDLPTGEMEGKYLKFKKDTLRDLMDSIEIAEGILTHATATLLKAKLEAEGAEVFLTRKENGMTAFGKTFEEWLREDKKKVVDSLYTLGRISLQQKQFFQSNKPSRRDIFRVIFKDLELQERGKIINTWRPDLTIIIHFNVDETNTGWTKPTQRNFNMAFVGGAFMKSDLSSTEKRFEFLRLLLSDDLERSINLSAEVLKSFEAELKVKTASPKDAKYLKEGCILTEKPGVYC
ncbi:MAG: N-acetylmuramoyl-L-alanine amidase, partial [Bacteroidota bacterium]|nr:N-acetylmuramoyl-L-alanine amidase [Bacteroidota bacterium]